MFLLKDLIENSNIDVEGGTSGLKILYKVPIGQCLEKLGNRIRFCQTILSRILIMDKIYGKSVILLPFPQYQSYLRK